MFQTYSCDDSKTVCDIIHEYTPAIKGEHVPLVIDNGSYQCRVGWATSTYPVLNFKNVIAKNRGNRKEQDWDVQVANEIPDLDAVRWLLRTSFDFNVVVNFSVQETLFDYSFKHLGIDTDENVAHPVVVTEPIANPTHCRKNMSELLFEAYAIPSLAYGIDCLFSHYFNKFNGLSRNALIVSSGFQSTHILPIVDGCPDIKNTFRINLGGYNCSAYLQRLLQFRYPRSINELTLTRMDQIIQNVCKVATCYSDDAKMWSDTKYRLNNTTILNFCNDERNKSTQIEQIKISEKTLCLEKKLKQTEYKLLEVECIIELEHENPEAAVKVAKDYGCTNLEEIKEMAQKIRSDIESVRKQLNELYHKDVSISKAAVNCGIEKIQAPEIIFQPSLVGFDQCGIAECIEIILKQYPLQVQEAMAQNVFVTGGNTKIEGFVKRVATDLRQICLHNMKTCVSSAEDPSLDAWKGAAKWASSDHNCWISRSCFNECGWDYLKEHSFSNPYATGKNM